MRREVTEEDVWNARKKPAELSDLLQQYLERVYHDPQEYMDSIDAGFADDVSYDVGKVFNDDHPEEIVVAATVSFVGVTPSSCADHPNRKSREVHLEVTVGENYIDVKAVQDATNYGDVY